MPETVTVDAFCAETESVELLPAEIVDGLAVMLTLGAVLVELTVMLSDDEKKNPEVSHARIRMEWVPFPSESEAVSVELELLAEFTESTYSTIPVIGCSLSSAAALNCTGELTVEPEVGEQILTVRSAVAVQATALCAQASTATQARMRIEKWRSITIMTRSRIALAEDGLYGWKSSRGSAVAY